MRHSSRLPVSSPRQIAVVVTICALLGIATPAPGQTHPPVESDREARAPAERTPVVPTKAPEPSTSSAEVRSRQKTRAREETPKMPTRGLGFRFGQRAFGDDLVDVVFPDATIGGIDYRMHVTDLWMAFKFGLDVGYAHQDVANADLVLSSVGFSLLAAPPPGLLGTSDGRFFLYPYAGVGLDGALVFLSSDVGSASDSGLGFHAIGGLDLVLGRVVSFGAEVQYAFAAVGGVQFGGVGFFGSLRFHWASG